MSLLDEFKGFITKGNVIDMAVGVVIGLAFNALIQAFVADIITPLIGVFLKVNFSGYTVSFNGSTFLVGDLVNKAISFLIIAAVVFFLIVKPIMAMDARRKAKVKAAPPTTRECPACLSQIPLKARRCMYCTSDVTPAA
jgi:large conductance mechanosensitive channel